jgi:ATP-dependent Lon protease
MKKTNKQPVNNPESEQLPLLGTRNIVLFPGVSVPLIVGREKSLQAVKAASESDNLIVVVAQKDPHSEDLELSNLYGTGTLAKIESIVESKSLGTQVFVRGLSRFRIDQVRENEGLYRVEGAKLEDSTNEDEVRKKALTESLRNLLLDLLKLFPDIPEQASKGITMVKDPAHLADLAAAYVNLSIEEQQKILEERIVEKRIEALLELLQKQKEVLTLQKDIQTKTAGRLNEEQRKALLREQLKEIKAELGEEDEGESEELEEKLNKEELPEEVRKIVDRELKRLKQIPSASMEHQVSRNYLEWLAELPWNKSTRDHMDLKEASKTLDEDHYGLDIVKERILQFLAVAKLKNSLKGPILCLVGPPGVGKTSLGKSIARALGRKFARTSLGGVRDEAEIRGHRRTYVGAMPGKIAQTLKRVGVNNPVIMLDEIDKLGSGVQGDPSSALLEVLDPEQNDSFVDHYLDVPFDLSNVFFICTANVGQNIPAPLKDRMEMIDVSSYTAEEKHQIAKRHLWKKVAPDHGLKADQVVIDDKALKMLITRYTREAGVRELTRQLGAIARKVAQKKIEQGLPEEPEELIRVDAATIRKWLGPEKFDSEVVERVVRPGVISGLAWTPHGGEILFIEASHMKGQGELMLTGQLGDVMKESAKIALSLVKTEPLVEKKKFEFHEKDIHIHVPAGAIGKDGPSAGVGMVIALASLISGRRVNPRLGMSGEITLRGAVLPVGGIKEKVLAAHRAGITELILPKRNRNDLEKVPQKIQDELSFHFIETVEEAMEISLGKDWRAAPLNKNHQNQSFFDQGQAH